MATPESSHALLSPVCGERAAAVFTRLADTGDKLIATRYTYYRRLYRILKLLIQASSTKTVNVRNAHGLMNTYKENGLFALTTELKVPNGDRLHLKL